MQMHPGAKLKLRIDAYMGRVLDEAFTFIPDPEAYRVFRKLVLDQGNALVREFNEELAQYKVSYSITLDEIQELLKANGEKKDD